MNEFDVIVVGGGPAGTTAATLCAQRGLSVALFEHARFPRDKVCGNVINPNCWPVLERLGVDGKIRTLPHHEVAGATFTAPGRAILRIEGQPNGNRLVVIRRNLFDAVLLDHAREAGVTVFENNAVHGITAGHEVVTSSARYLSRTGIVGADGRHSIVAKTTGLVRSISGKNGHIAFQSDFPAPATVDDRVQLHLFPGGYCGLVRVDEERVNLCIVTTRQHARYHGDCEALFAHTVWKNPHFRALGITPELPEPLHSAHPLSTPANLPAGNSVLLVGDALRVMEPFTGQGIFFALRTAELAADAILNSRQPEVFYTAAVTRLYRHRSRTNDWLRRLMYHHRAARFVISALRHWPRMLSGLADNVLGEA